ncbi:MAG TPA: ABC transporter ATP-binding protein [Candidatus Thermoplasmatota archaeon]
MTETPGTATSPSAAVINIANLTKTYRKRRGVENVNLQVRKGEVFGFLGPNGAGKTTTIRVLLDLIRASSGNASIFGLDVRKSRDEIHERIGYLPGEVGLYERLTVRDQLEDFAAMRGGMPPNRIEQYAARFDLDLTKPLRALSKGNKQKVGLVQALMHEPELLILDEPTSGLDPLMQQRFNATVREARARGRTVFLSSHVLPEVEHLCDRVAIIRDGRILAVSTVPEIKGRARRTVAVRLRMPAPPTVLASAPGILEPHVEGTVVRFAQVGPIGAALAVLQPYGVLDVATHEPSLEDVFLAYYGGGPA